MHLLTTVLESSQKHLQLNILIQLSEMYTGSR